MPLPSRLRHRAKAAKSVVRAPAEKLARWEVFAHAATIISSLAAAVTILVSTYQFREAMRVQQQSIALQLQALQTERSSKASELFQKFLEERYKPLPEKPEPDRERYLFERNNQALMWLNALYETTKGDEQWESIVFHSLQYFDRFARERSVLCLNLTDDFRAFMLKVLPNAPADSWKMCRDLNDSE